MAEPYSVTVRHGGTPTKTVVVPSKERTEFDRFANLTKKLTQVPKSEVDEKRKS
jgi:hypothetical protein